MYEARLAALVMEIQDGASVLSGHAVTQMERADRRITRRMLEAALTAGDVEQIEDYPNDPRGASCLVLCWFDGCALHVNLSYPPTPTIITVYWPDSEPDEWSADFRRRMER